MPKMNCNTCGYNWNRPVSETGRATCPKCQCSLASAGKSLHGRRLSMEDLVSHKAVDSLAFSSLSLNSSSKRQPGEVSTFKANASSACESTSGVCPKASGGPHKWKFGKCSGCGKAEGKILKNIGAVTNPGTTGGSTCGKGGKCMFKFSKCTKCGKSELASGVRGMSGGRRSSVPRAC